MFTCTPAGLAPGRPVVVALHGCTQGAADYYAHSGWAALADRWQLEVVFAQTSSTKNALSCFSTADSTRGNGEAASIKSVVDKAVADHASDTSRVFVTGLSAGGAMTANLLADYPDVFAGGAIRSRPPATRAPGPRSPSSRARPTPRSTPSTAPSSVTSGPR